MSQDCGCSLPQVQEGFPYTGPSVGVTPLEEGGHKQGDAEEDRESLRNIWRGTLVSEADTERCSNG